MACILHCAAHDHVDRLLHVHACNFLHLVISACSDHINGLHAVCMASLRPVPKASAVYHPWHACMERLLLATTEFSTTLLAWFVQDGSIQYEVKLTGCLSTNGLSMGEGPEPTHGTLLAPGLNAQVHQHFFCARLDMAVDDSQGGAAISVTEVRTQQSTCIPVYVLC